MAIVNYKYKDTSYKMLEKFTRWFRNEFNIRDWSIVLIQSIERPPEFIKLSEYNPGGCVAKEKNLSAIVWVNPNGCKLQHVHPIEVLCHEMLHVLMDAFNVTSENYWCDDQFIYRLESIIVEKFCSTNNIKLEKGEI